jgi:hypothetical protein
MEHKIHYDTVSNAISKLREQGFTLDFNLKGNSLVCNEAALRPEDFEIVDTYRYEGDSDPGDEAVVYAIRSASGLKGILVAGYGTTADSASTELLKKLHF